MDVERRRFGNKLVIIATAKFVSSNQIDGNFVLSATHLTIEKYF